MNQAVLKQASGRNVTIKTINYPLRLVKNKLY